MGTVKLLLCLLLAVAPLQDETPAPAPERVSEVVQSLKKALAGKEKEPKTRALHEAGRVPAKEVVVAIRRAFRDEDPEVEQAGIQALRFLEHEDALDALHALLEKDRTVKKNPELVASAWKAIGQHANPRSVRALAKEPFDAKNGPATRARLLGLGRIRSTESLEALLGLLKSTTPRTVERHMRDLRMSLMVLTGVDQGPNAQSWLRWWRDHKKGFEVAPERPRLPRTETERWLDYWGLEEDVGRTKRREDRGDDPERRGARP